ncbi:EamA family transporter [Amycolatopsis rubida]|uniref:EamA family transporter n=1 Tax=Amycolatopsis rubida TaxID=112413 RepID=A0ABX0BKA8_9PSEU|nr:MULTISPECIES: EamA family transporter [Amycolatopsis]MYW90987.1 EamA family transporter [Amycolatopsis rubida]NEC55972.1 EamA family transporter [Amycolatopsis rubida]OAP25940.1 Threonine/homoserine exporter RhtA [Amycolatopsis sp. M39]
MTGQGGIARATGLSLVSWVLFASSGPLAKAVLDAGWSPAAVTAVRIGLAAVLLTPGVALLRPRALRFRRGELWLPLGYGLLGVAGVQLFFFVAVSRIPVAVAMVLVNLSPVLVALWARVVRRTRLPAAVWLGIALAIAGLVLIAGPGPGAKLDFLGVAAGLASAVCSAGYFLLGERGARRHDPLGMTAAGLAIGAVATIAISPLWTLEVASGPVALGGATIPVWLALAILAVFGTVLPYLAGLHALGGLPVTLAGLLALAEPLVAAVLAGVLLGQALGPGQLLGAVMLLGGGAGTARGLVSVRPGSHRDEHSRVPTSSPPPP